MGDFLMCVLWIAFGLLLFLLFLGTLVAVLFVR